MKVSELCDFLKDCPEGGEVGVSVDGSWVALTDVTFNTKGDVTIYTEVS